MCVMIFIVTFFLKKVMHHVMFLYDLSINEIKNRWYKYFLVLLIVAKFLTLKGHG
jgi:succinate dehydrogenase hydrophobic anchor subunit